ANLVAQGDSDTIGWLLVTAATNIVVPQLEMVGKEHSVSLSPQDAPAMVAMKRLGLRFEQFDSDSAWPCSSSRVSSRSASMAFVRHGTHWWVKSAAHR